MASCPHPTIAGLEETHKCRTRCPALDAVFLVHDASGMSQSKGPSWRVLVVDDDSLLLGAVSRALERAGHSIVRAQTAEDALELLALETPQAILSDIGLPGMSGIELLRRVLSEPRHRTIGLVLWSGSGTDASAGARALAAHGVEILSKPASIATVIAAIERARSAAARR